MADFGNNCQGTEHEGPRFGGRIVIPCWILRSAVRNNLDVAWARSWPRNRVRGQRLKISSGSGRCKAAGSPIDGSQTQFPPSCGRFLTVTVIGFMYLLFTHPQNVQPCSSSNHEMKHFFPRFSLTKTTSFFNSTATTFDFLLCV